MQNQELVNMKYSPTKEMTDDGLKTIGYRPPLDSSREKIKYGRIVCMLSRRGVEVLAC